jgi:hypothetical protein
MVRYSPLDRRATHRLVAAFRETGRGLIVGTGGTALAQGAVAGATYAALGVPNPITLGALTAMGAFVPAVGTALVWAPVALGLAIAGHPVRAVVLAAVGISIIGTIDNVLRPVLSRAGRLRLPAVVLFLAVLGGLDLAGGWGGGAAAVGLVLAFAPTDRSLARYWELPRVIAQLADSKTAAEALVQVPQPAPLGSVVVTCGATVACASEVASRERLRSTCPTIAGTMTVTPKRPGTGTQLAPPHPASPQSVGQDSTGVRAIVMAEAEPQFPAISSPANAAGKSMVQVVVTPPAVNVSAYAPVGHASFGTWTVSVVRSQAKATSRH